MVSKKIKKRIFALLAGVLLLGGGVLANPLPDSNPIKDPFYDTFKQIGANHPDWLTSAADVDYIESLNKNFVKDFDVMNDFDRALYSNEKELHSALVKGDYEEWKESVESLYGFPKEVEVIPEEEFNILKEIRKNEDLT